MSISFLAGVRGPSVRTKKTILHPESVDYPRRKEMSTGDWLKVWKEVLSKQEYEKRCTALRARGAT
jgi:hypothetical protein